MRRVRSIACLGMIVLIALLFASCGRESGKLRIKGFDGIEMMGLSALRLNCEVENLGRKDITISSAELTLRKEGVELFRLRLVGELKIAAQTTTKLSSRWKIETENPVAMLLLLKSPTSEQLSSMTLDYTIVGSKGRLRKTFCQEMVPLSDFLSTFAVENQPKR